mmetsp:Transcript_6498/g.13870  ORF Transcript_6498/g.13870 Transcript_6498/m.13870 type:complete len:265 (+) Transcript_6498:50-844(+)
MSQNIQVAEIVPTFLADSGLSEYDDHLTPNGYTIQGDTMQILTIPVAPGASIQAEPGTMAFGSKDMKQTVKLGGFGRLMSGEGLVKACWKNKGSEMGYIGLTPNIPATIIPVNLDAEGGSIKCKRDAFMAALNPDTKLSISMLNSNSCAACCCSGMDVFMQDIRGSGMVFIQGHGTIMEKELASGEEIVVDTNSVVAVASGVSVDVVRSGGCATMCCSGESIFNTTLRGPGRIILASMPLEKLRALFPRPAPRTGAGDKLGSEN